MQLVAGVDSSTRHAPLRLTSGEAHPHAAGVDTSGRLIATDSSTRLAAYTQLLAGRSREVMVTDATEASVPGECMQATVVTVGELITNVLRAWTPPIRAVVGPTPGTDALRYLISDRHQLIAGRTPSTVRPCATRARPRAPRGE